jgi:tetratricopeptide (TPR) repeat protein
MLKKTILTAMWSLFLLAASAQDASKLYDQGVEKAQAGKLKDAIVLFSKSIELRPEDYYCWYNRGIAKSMLNLYEEALPDFEQTIKLAPEYKKGYLNRGNTRKHLTDYEGAIADYTYSLKLDSNYIEAYYNRGIVYEMLGKKQLACKDFQKAKAEKKIEQCNDNTQNSTEMHVILRLTKTAADAQYGYTSEKPILVGAGPSGGPGNQEAYLDLLRDQQGKPITYERLASCCDYKSEHGLFGIAKLDKYKITYLNENGKAKSTVVFISFYDYEEPQIIHGFKTIAKN